MDKKEIFRPPGHLPPGRGQDMTQDIRFQIECFAAELAEMLMPEYGWDIRRALAAPYSSAAFAKLNDPECGLYYQGAVHFFQFLKTDIETGKVA